MTNPCHFSPCRKWRYTLLHRWDTDDLFTQPKPNPRLIAWIALNPSTADENQLDPTLRRIRGFSQLWGYDGFIMLNLFAWRDTDPKKMKQVPDPVGPENDRYILQTANSVDLLITAWGTHGTHLDREQHVLNLLKPATAKIAHIGLTKNKHPRHPLYAPGDHPPIPWFK